MVEEDLTIPAPAKEHNVYSPAPAEGEYQPVPVKSVELLVQYVVATAAIETRASSFDTKALQLATPAAWDAAKTLRSAPVPLALQVMRRTGEFERLTLPGEKPEPPFPK